MRKQSFVLVAVVLAACGTNKSKTAPDAGDVADAAVQVDAAPIPVDAGFPAFRPTDTPRVVTSGGPVLNHPTIIPVVFAKDDATTKGKLLDFVSKLGATDYWHEATTEYDVGAATGGTPVVLGAEDDPPATLDDADLQKWLAAKLQANDARFGTPDANTVYALFYPAGTTITTGAPSAGGGGGGDGGMPDAGRSFTQSSCMQFGGYHDSIQLDAAHGSLHVAYAVIPRCSTFNGLYGLDAITGPASHELIEAATDPFPGWRPAYQGVDDAHFYWQSLLGGGETGDMCAQNPDSFAQFPELGYVVQRSWSNVAAVAGMDPCVPARADVPYFNTIPTLSDDVAYSIGGQSIMVKGVKIAAGQSATIELDMLSSGPTQSWTVDAIDTATLRGQPAQLAFDFDKTSGNNGDKLHLTITVMTASTRKRETFLLESKQGNHTNLWVGVVGN
jgi:hypothetical protein